MNNIRNECDLCKSSSANFKILFRKNEYTVVKCRTCGLIFILEIPSEDELKKCYDENYYEGSVYSSYSSEEPGRLRYYSEMLMKAENYIETRNGKFLEIGCATGSFLDCLKFFGHNAVGIEKSEYSAAIARTKNHTVYTENVEQLVKKNIMKEKSFDGVFMWDVLEHLNHPYDTLKNANYLMRNGGLLVLNTLNIASPTVRYLKEEWSHFYPPFHLFFYSVKTLRQLLSETGYNILKIKTAGPLFFDDIKNKYYFFEKFTSNRFVQRVTNKLNMGYAQFVIAKKIVDV